MSTITFNITGQITIDAKDIEAFLRSLQTQAPTLNNQKTVEPVSNPMAKLAYTTKECAELLGTSPNTVYSLLSRGLLKSSGALRHKRITKAEIERFLKETTRSDY